ncbi:Anthranilate phosphoribosyltransferase [Sinobacterium norvegicum]|uniref:Anthranilate phosphoribosyltransferase n=1 Tax=Sinobacterium norvegicum TaxID=1641715 RepID=A0ABM9AE31_9GAMM|nr:anthranilate phosphoribosyltransferase [Sinobacterium norvegicum]CAH0991470.1 Anthranilate phosphoribosyltransferase [Sinobacterium norvegicum]
MDIQQAIARLMDGESLTTAEMTEVMTAVMTGAATDAQIGGLLVALRMKGETVEELVGAATVMRALSTKVTVEGENLVDIVGTGGDGSSLFNVSTASSFVAAAAGAQVAKHGNRSVTSRSGSADLLEAAGVRLDLTAEQVALAVKEVGLGFMFAVNHHSAMKHAIGPRKELKARTIFNLLGPLTNPAGVTNLSLGVFSKAWVRPYAEAMRQLGAEHVIVAHSEDGLDEFSIAAKTFVAELKDGVITEYTVVPEDFGLQRGSLEDVVVSGPDESLAMIKAAFSQSNETATDMVAMNAGAALYCANIASTLKEGVAMAQDAIGSGAAKHKLAELAEFTQTLIAANK